MLLHLATSRWITRRVQTSRHSWVPIGPRTISPWPRVQKDGRLQDADRKYSKQPTAPARISAQKRNADLQRASPGLRIQTSKYQPVKTRRDGQAHSVSNGWTSEIRRSRIRAIVRGVWPVFTTVQILWVVYEWLGWSSYITGPSMQPTFNPDLTTPDYSKVSSRDERDAVPHGLYEKIKFRLIRGGEEWYRFLVYWTLWSDRVVVDKWHRLSNLQRGEVVMIINPLDPWKIVAKRIAALEGDTIFPRTPDGIHCMQQDELQWMGEKVLVNGETALQIPEGSVWVEGDFAEQSRDSNYYGSVPMELLVGKVKWIWWPLHRFGPVVVEEMPEVQKRVKRRPDGWARDLYSDY